MSILDALILGLVQGLTEFLPVSSSAHLVLAGHLLGWKPDDVSFEVIVHAATSLAIITVYYSRITPLLAEWPYLLRPWTWGKEWKLRPQLRMALLLILSAVPVGLVGVLAKDELESVFRNLQLVGVLLIVTALWLVSGRFRPAKTRAIGLRSTIGMGLAQTLAILPGLSRSGLTITSGLWCGLEREDAARFSFLMVLIPLAGATLLELRHGLSGGAGAIALLAGGAAAYVSGVLALRFLLRLVGRGRLDLFAPYCLVVGLIALFS